MKKKLLIWVTILLLFILLLLNGLTYLFNNHFKDYFIKSINNNISSAYKIQGNVNISLIDQFPYASLSLNKVKLINLLQPSDIEVMNLGNIHLIFNWLDILKNGYDIKKIIIEDGYINLKEDEYGIKNYMFWVKNDSIALNSSSNNSVVNIVLEDIELRNVLISYENKKSNQKVLVKSNRSNISGAFKGNEFSLDVATNLDVKYISINDERYLYNKNIQINTIADFTDGGKSFSFKDTEIEINEQSFIGNVIWKDKGEDVKYIDLKLKKEQGKLSDFISLLPGTYAQRLQGFDNTGDLTINLSVIGDITANLNPHYELTFALKDGTISHESINTTLKNVMLMGVVSNGKSNSDKTSFFHLKKFTANLIDRPLKLEIKILNFENPLIDIKANAVIPLKQIASLIDPDFQNNLSGVILINDFSLVAKAFTDIDSIKTMSNPIIHNSGKVEFIDVNLKIKEEKFKSINGVFVFESEQLHIRSLNMKHQHSDYSIKLNTKNIVKNFLYDIMEINYKPKPIVVKGFIKSNKIVLNDLINFDIQQDTFGETDETNISAKQKKWWEYTSGTIDFDVKEFKYDSFYAYNLMGNLVIDAPQIYFNNVSFNAAEGAIKTDGVISLDGPGELKLKADISGKNIAISKMFRQLQNFGQTEITDQNLQGYLDTELKITGYWADSFSLVEDSLYTLADVTIRNGQLKNYEPLKSLSAFIKVRDLENIKFSEITNQIEIKDRIIAIPTMLLLSNAADMSISGIHDFDNNINYNMKINLSNIIANRFKKDNKLTVENFEEATDGEINLFLSMVGNVDDYKIKYNKKAVKEKIKTDLKNEKKELLNTLRKEFNNKPKRTKIQDWEDEEIEFIE